MPEFKVVVYPDSTVVVYWRSEDPDNDGNDCAVLGSNSLAAAAFTAMLTSLKNGAR